MIIGLILIVLGLGTFITGGVLTNDAPGVEKAHAILMFGGFALVIIGGIVVAASVLT